MRQPALWCRDKLAESVVSGLATMGARIYAALVERFRRIRCGAAFDREAQSLVRADGRWMHEELQEALYAWEESWGGYASGEECADLLGVIALHIWAQSTDAARKFYFLAATGYEMRPQIDFCPALLNLQAATMSDNKVCAITESSRVSEYPWLSGLVSKLDRNANRSACVLD